MKKIKSIIKNNRLISYCVIGLQMSLFFLCCQSLLAQSNVQYTIVGRVVDLDGKPIKDASIFLEPVHYKSSSFERFIEGDAPNSNGEFRIVRDKKKVSVGEEAFLFVTADK